MTAAEAKEFSVPEEERGYYLTATVTKNNYAPPQPKVFLKRGDGGVLSAAQLTSKKAQQNADLSTRVLDLIRDEAKRGALYSKAKFEATFGGQDGIFKTGKVAVRNILGELLQLAGNVAAASSPCPTTLSGMPAFRARELDTTKLERGLSNLVID